MGIQLSDSSQGHVEIWTCGCRARCAAPGCRQPCADSLTPYGGGRRSGWASGVFALPMGGKWLHERRLSSRKCQVHIEK
jgi:hypothetical protein